MASAPLQPQQDSLTLTCPAKVNLALSVARPQPDGMHPIASWMIAMVFGDTLTLSHPSAREDQQGKQASSSQFELTYAADAPLPGRIDWPLEKDLAFRAHVLLERHAGRTLPVHATLNKRIPTGAGLGGGSSDAAAMLAGLNSLFSLNIDLKTLCGLAATLGSDVTFLTAAMFGKPSALVSGLGEIITPLPLNKPLHLVLIFPGVACPTGPVYKAFDAHLETASVLPEFSRVEAMMTRHHSPEELNMLLFNDLATPACVVQPVLAQLQAKAQEITGRQVHVTGSGATLFTLADDSAHATTLATALRDSLGLPALATRTR